jgi:hypothetical protein
MSLAVPRNVQEFRTIQISRSVEFCERTPSLPCSLPIIHFPHQIPPIFGSRTGATKMIPLNDQAFQIVYGIRSDRNRQLNQSTSSGRGGLHRSVY